MEGFVFLNHEEVYFKEQFLLPAVKENTPRKQISHPSEWNASIWGQLNLRKLHLTVCCIMPRELLHLRGLSSLSWDQLVLILGGT